MKTKTKTTNDQLALRSVLLLRTQIATKLWNLKHHKLLYGISSIYGTVKNMRRRKEVSLMGFLVTKGNNSIYHYANKHQNGRS